MNLVDCYEIWVDLAPGVKDSEFIDAVHQWLDFLQKDGHLECYRIKRRKLGFGPDGLGEFNISIEFKGLAQIDEAFFVAAKHDKETDKLHSEVWSRVTNYKSGLYRDYPDKF